jgi:cytoskeletal protein RodZ
MILMKINIKLFIVMMMFALPLCLPLFPQETQTGPDTTPAEQQPAPAIPESPSTNEAPSTSPENAATPESPPAKQEEVKAPEDATATTAPQPSAAPSGEMKPTIIILKPLLSFEDVRTYTPSVEEASEESAYEERPAI